MTPGSARSFSSTRSWNTTTAGSSAYALPTSENCSDSILDGLKPGFAWVSATTVRSIRPAPASSTRARTRSATTSTERARDRPPTLPRESIASVCFAPRQAGTSPKTRLVSTAIAAVNASTRPSTPMCSSRGSETGANAASPSHGGHREEHARHRAAGAEHEALGQQLPDDARAPGAEDGAQGELALPRHRARQQQVRDVGARDEQDEPHGAEQHVERGLHVPRQRVAQRHDRQRPGLVVGRMLLAHPLADRVHLRGGVRQGHASLEAAEPAQVLAAPARRIPLRSYPIGAHISADAL